MKLARLSLERLPGIDRPFEIDEFGAGLNIIVGPNGIGKSRLCTAVRALLWHERGIPGDPLTARAEFDHDGARWRVTRDGSLHAWQRDGIDVSPPILPGERLEGCFFLGLRDLLDDSDRAGRDLAAEIRRQMSGGFDLAELERGFAASVSTRIGLKEGRELNAAESEIRQAERAQAEVERRELELVSLERSAAEAEQAGRRLVHFDTAIGLQSLRIELRQREAELGERSPALDRLDGGELARLDRLEEALQQKRDERDDSQRALLESREAAIRSGLSDPIDRTALATGRERVEAVADLERQIDAARLDVRGAREAVATTRRALGMHAAEGMEASADDPGETLPIEASAELFSFLRESGRLERDREGVEERLRLLAARHFSDDEARRLATLKRAIEPLRDWLSAPERSTQAGPRLWPARGMLVSAGAVCALLGLGLALTIAAASPIASGLCGLGLGFLAASLLVRARAGEIEDTKGRTHAEGRYPDAVEPPSSWTREAVTARLHDLEDEFSRLDSSEKRARDRAVERGQLEEALNGFVAREEVLETRRRELAAQYGLEPMGSDAEWVDLARALEDARRAGVEGRRAEARLAELTDLRGRRLESIGVFMTSVGEAAPVDAASARAALHALEERDRTLRTAQVDGAREEARLARLAPEIERLSAERAAIFETADLDTFDRSLLVRRLSGLDGFRALKTRCAELVRDIARARGALDAAGESDLVEADLATLQSERTRLDEVARGRDALNVELGAIRQSARAAREGHALEEAIARRDALRRELGDRREEALAAATGRFLIEGVRREHELNQRPRVFERARDRFGLFTHHRYELKVSPGEAESFVAVDGSSGEGLAPAKLSDGTRAQLILAARLAFAEEAEAGADLPLFLDEAMDHSDPERFHAIARSLARMVADDGRQIFYLSNDPTDVERFETAFAEEGCDRVQILDLAEIRGRSLRVTGSTSLRVAPLPSVPSAAGETAEHYGAAIGVTRLDPRAEASSQHVYYLLRDDLALLERLLRARIETVGQCLNILRNGDARADEIRGATEIADQLEARIGLLDSFCHGWREGRGRAVGRAEIEASGAVTKTYLEGVVEVADELEGNAARLIDVLRERSDSRLSGFRSKSTEDLESHLAKGGYLDDRPVLGETELLDRVMSAPSARQLPTKVATELVHQWWSFSEKSAPSDG